MVVDGGHGADPGHLGVLASVGVTDVVVVRRGAVGVLSTGDELVEGGAPLRPGQLRDSNRHALCALVASDGFEVVDLGLVRDDKEAVAAAIERRHAAVRCTAHERRRQHGRLRRGQGGAVGPRRGHALDADGHPSREAVRVRDRRIDARVRPAGQPRVVARLLRAPRPSRPAADDRHGPDDLDRPGSTPSPRRRSLAAATARRTSHEWSSHVDDGRLVVRSAGARARTSSRRWPRRTGWRSCPTARGRRRSDRSP